MSLKSSGILLANLGTPDDSSPESVARYLKEFLMDPDVINIPNPFRWILVNGFIVPKRKFTSAHSYQQIWLSEGSPLAVHTFALQKKLQALFPEIPVEVGMRYGKPSLEKSIEIFKNKKVKKLLVYPMFPQYAEATTETLRKKLNEFTSDLEIIFIEDYYKEDFFIQPLSRLIKDEIREKNIDHFLFSFHGLPVSHIKKICNDSKEKCNPLGGDCEPIGENNKKCYRAQCFDTCRALAKILNIDRSMYTVSFQSRLGRADWTTPATDKTIAQMPARGIKNLAVVCPSFITDCLETLEEIDMQGKELFLKAGGKEFHYIKCLNSLDFWASSLRDTFSKLLS